MGFHVAVLAGVYTFGRVVPPGALYHVEEGDKNPDSISSREDSSLCLHENKLRILEVILWKQNTALKIGCWRLGSLYTSIARRGPQLSCVEYLFVEYVIVDRLEELPPFTPLEIHFHKIPSLHCISVLCESKSRFGFKSGLKLPFVDHASPERG